MKKKVKTSSLPFVFLSFPGLTGINRHNGQAIKDSPENRTEQSHKNPEPQRQHLQTFSKLK